MPYNFAITGAAGFVAPRHIKAIKETGNLLVAAADPHDSVGLLDRYFLDVAYFKEIERFDRHMERLHRGPEGGRIHWVSVCSPNYLHDAHIRMALRSGANALCEKPLVINPWNLDALQSVEQETGKRVHTVLQLRVHPSLLALREQIVSTRSPSRRQVVLTYITGRGPWYDFSWKGSEERSGGLVTNIGIHFFDLLMWYFGPASRCEVHLREPRRWAGYIELQDADVRWLLSVNTRDLPTPAQPGVNTTHRSITVDGEELEFTEGFTDLHTRVYEKSLRGEGFGIDDARPPIELVHRIRHMPATEPGEKAHPMLGRLLKG